MAKYRILSFDGGGVRGLLSAVILEQLEERVPGWIAKADLLAGTSTGGIIALGLAKGLGPSDLRALYYDRSPAIFKDSVFDNLKDLGRTLGAEYSTKHRRKELERVLGRTRMKSLKKRVLITAFDLDNEHPDRSKRHWKPKFFHNFPGDDSDGNERVVDVALYTSAAPTYFPSVDGYIDGGVVANNPSMAALAQTQDARSNQSPPKIRDCRLLSVGTGFNLSSVRGKRHDWGYTQWAKPLITLMLDGLTGVADYQCRQILGDRYQRINYAFPPGKEVDTDEYRKRDRLVDIAENKMTAELDAAAEWIEATW